MSNAETTPPNIPAKDFAPAERAALQAENEDLHSRLTSLTALVGKKDNALRDLLTASENADETGYVDGEGWLPLERIQQAAAEALSLTPAGMGEWVRKEEFDRMVKERNEREKWAWKKNDENAALRDNLAEVEKERDRLVSHCHDKLPMMDGCQGAMQKVSNAAYELASAKARIAELEKQLSS